MSDDTSGTLLQISQSPRNIEVVDCDQPFLDVCTSTHFHRRTEQNTDFDKERPFGIDVQVRHRKSGKEGTLRGVADLDREEVSERTGAVKQYWNVAAYDDAGDVVSDGVIMTKIVSLARLAQKEQERTS